MGLGLLVTSVIILLCVFFNNISQRLGFPMLLAFIVLGMLFGSDGFIKIDFDNYAMAETVCSTALIFIMFYGGFGTKWKEAKPVATIAMLMSSAGVVLTAVLTAAFCYYALKMSLLEAMLFGAVISSTDAASVFSILRSKRLNLKYNTASMLEVESGSNDPFSYMLVIIVLAMMKGAVDPSALGYLIFAQVVFAVVAAFVISKVAVFVMKHYKFETHGFDAAFLVGIALLSYALPNVLDGNGYLSAYIVGIVLGNSKIPNKRGLVPFFDGIMGIMQMLIFFLLGLLAAPSHLPAVFGVSLAIALFLTFIGRPLAMLAVLAPYRAKFNQYVIVSWTGLRGAASIVFAIIAMTEIQNKQLPFENDLFHIVFCIVLISIALQGSLIPYLSKKLQMVDNSVNVLKTFTDYSDETEVQFIQYAIFDGHPWEGKIIRELTLPPNTLLVMIIRDHRKVIPNGETMILCNDVIIVSALAVSEEVPIGLTEVFVEPEDERVGMTLTELTLEPEQLIILIKRGSQSIIPNGSTVIEIGDTLVIGSSPDI